MNKKQEAKLRQEFEKGFKEQFKNGMAQGVFAICKVIHDKAIDESMPVEDRLAEIVRFCRISLDVDKTKKQTDAK